jgi:hypothetical protein
MVVLGGLLWLWRTLDENQKNPSIFAIWWCAIADCHLMDALVLFFPFG